MYPSLSSPSCEDLINILFGSFPVALAVLEGDERIIRAANYLFCQMMGKPEGSIIGVAYVDVAIDQESLAALQRLRPASVSGAPRATEISCYKSGSQSYIIIPVPATADHTYGTIM